MKPHIGRARYGKPRVPDIVLFLWDRDGKIVTKDTFGTELPQELALHRPNSPFGEFAGFIRRSLEGEDDIL